MAQDRLELVLRRDRAIIAAALAALTVLSWAYVVWLAAAMHVPAAPAGAATSGGSMPHMAMPGMDMSGMAMSGAGMASGGVAAPLAPALAPWSAADFAFMAIMWAVMMVGMMTPSAAPMILLYGRVGRHAIERGRPFAATGWFAAGYLLAWVGFALAATVAQWALERAALLTPMMASASSTLAAAVLIAAGTYQWTPLKQACLAQCQAPLVFIQRHGGFRRDPRGALAMGARHGGYCVGCCWALMALLFVGGVMNVLWIAGLAALVLVEKLAPAGALVARASGIVLIGAGVWLLIAA